MSTVEQDAPPVEITNSGITKQIRNLRKKVAVKVKPPQLETDESGDTPGRYMFVSVDSEGNENRVETTLPVWRKAHGFDSPDDAEPSSKGYRGKMFHQFLLGFELDDTGKVIPLLKSVDIIHMQPVTGPVKLASAAEGKQVITVTIDVNSGELSVDSYPSHYSGGEAPGLIALIDATTEIRPGKDLGKGYKVIDVRGNVFEVSVPPRKK